MSISPAGCAGMVPHLLQLEATDYKRLRSFRQALAVTILMYRLMRMHSHGVSGESQRTEGRRVASKPERFVCRAEQLAQSLVRQL